MICSYINEMPLIFFNITLQVGMECIKIGEEEEEEEEKGDEGQQVIMIGVAVGGSLLLLLLALRFGWCWLGCTKMYESQNFMMADSQNWLFYPTKSLQKELGFLLQNCGGAQFLKFLAFLEGKTPPKRA